MRLFLLTIMNGLTLAALYFLVASGFTLVFGLMRNVNLAHGSLYLLGAYVGWVVGDKTDSWLLAVAAGFLTGAVIGLVLQLGVFRFMQGQDLRQTLVTIGLSIVLADLALWIWGAEIYTFDPPKWIYGSTELPVIEKFPTYRLFVLLAAVVIGIGLWTFLAKTRVGTGAGRIQKTALMTLRSRLISAVSCFSSWGGTRSGGAGLAAGESASISCTWST